MFDLFGCISHMMWCYYMYRDKSRLQRWRRNGVGYVSIQTHNRVCMYYVYLYVCMYISMSVGMYVEYADVCINICIDVSTHIMHVCIYVCVYTSMCVCLLVHKTHVWAISKLHYCIGHYLDTSTVYLCLFPLFLLFQTIKGSSKTKQTILYTIPIKVQYDPKSTYRPLQPVYI